MGSHHLHSLEGCGSILGNLANKTKKSERIAEDHPSSFIQQMFLGCQICARHCFRSLENTSEQNRHTHTKSVLVELGDRQTLSTIKSCNFNRVIRLAITE